MKEVEENGRSVVNLGNAQFCLPVASRIGSKTLTELLKECLKEFLNKYLNTFLEESL